MKPMRNILEEIAERTRERVAAKKKEVPLEKIAEAAQKRAANGFTTVNEAPPLYYRNTCHEQIRCNSESSNVPVFETALRSNDIAFICEIKRASPSKGLIAEDFRYLDIARDYEAAGAAAISVLTEPFYFKGGDSYLREIAKTVKLPLLRKDFTVDEYMIYEAKLLGASAVLLICALLDEGTLAEFIALAHSLGLSALVEAHDEAEVRIALKAGARIIGVNNRSLKTFEVDMSNSLRLRTIVPDDIIFVSESGIHTGADIALLRQSKVNAVLVGETLMRAKDKKAALDALRGFGNE
jgi:indole-3-glycerol phosphate synthase